MDEERVPVFPRQHIPVARPGGPLWLGAVELGAPLALGQRALVVGPPRSGKTTLLQQIAASIAHHRPHVELHAVLVDRPIEEFMEWRVLLPRESVHGSSSDEGPAQHIAIDHVFDAASDIAGSGGDAVVLVDSLAALARAFNVTADEDERVLTGGLLQHALRDTRARFGLGRALEPDGSLTVVATAGVDTGSELDDVVYHELAGTGNMELRLGAAARDAGLFPPIDMAGSGARHDEHILGEHEAMRRALLRAKVVEHGETAGLALLLEELDSAGSLDALLDAATAG